MPVHVIALAHDYLSEPFSRKLVQGHSVLGLVLLIDPFTPEWLRGGQLYYYSVLCMLYRNNDRHIGIWASWQRELLYIHSNIWPTRADPRARAIFNARLSSQITSRPRVCASAIDRWELK